MCDLALPFTRHMLHSLADLGNMMKGLPEEVEKMKDELEKIQTFIFEADRMGAAEEDKERVMELVERAFRLEDIIDEYMICEQWQPARDPPFGALPSEAAGFIKTMGLRLQIAFKIKFSKWLKERSEKDGGLQVPSSSGPGPSSSGGNQDVAVQNLQDAALLLTEDEVVGFESPKDTLIDWLVNGRKERTVISVVAMGGQGKTTLARQVFNNQLVIESFPYRAWVTVSKSYTIEGLLRNMLQEFHKENKQSPPDGIFTMDRVCLKTEVRNYLQNKRYVVYFDDVWNTHFWDDVEHGLIDNKVGSRVFITTRDRDVINSCKKSSFVEVHELLPLTKEKSLDLLFKKAFFDLNGCCPPYLMNISFEIVKKCNGLPLAIVAIAGVLAGKDRDVLEWENFSQNLSSELEEDSSLHGIGKILGLSYDELPPSLKPCLLYFGMYPEGYEVRADRVVTQWIAEGFVKEHKGKSLEKVGEGYLRELIRRNLVQVSSSTLYGRVKGCRVHDLLREMILKKFEDLSFCKFISEDSQSVLNGKSRRLSLTTCFNDFMISAENSHIRSVLFFFNKDEIPELFVRIILAKIKFLKVLDLEGAQLHIHVPEILGTQTHLKYVSFRHTMIRSLPESIGELENLETLDLMGTIVTDMPKGTSKLRKLRHLMANYLNGSSLKDSVGGMTSLQTLYFVSLEDDDAIELIRELEKLRQLRMLGLLHVKEEHGSSLCSLFNKMQLMEKLIIKSEFREVVHLHSVSSLPMLRVLRIEAGLCTLPDWIPRLKSLVKLTLWDSVLTVDPLKSLQNTPNLFFLCIGSRAYLGDTLHAYEGAFPKLKHLQLRGLNDLEFFHIERGALPSLETLMLWGIPKLKKVPRGFQHLKNLKHLFAVSVSVSFEFDDIQAIEHVPLVEVYDYALKLTHRFKFGKEDGNMDKRISKVTR